MNNRLAKIILAQFVCMASMAAGPKTPAVLNFKEWKSERVQEALAHVVKVKTQLEVQKRKNEEESASVAFNDVLLGDAKLNGAPTGPGVDKEADGTLLNDSLEVKAKILDELKKENQTVVIKRKAELKAPKLIVKNEMSLEKAEAELARANLVLEMVREFTIKDYFQLYLQQQESKKESFSEAASRLSAPEVAELLALMDTNPEQRLVRSGHALLTTDQKSKTLK